MIKRTFIFDLLCTWQQTLRGLVAQMLLLGCASADATIESHRTAFTVTERAMVQTLGPWPPAAKVDPTNRVSGQAHAIELGRRLFRDARMSPVGYIACVTCHQPDRSFTDFKTRAHGLADLPRNTPSLLNVGQQRWFGRDGASDSLWLASVRPILDRREFDGSAKTVKKVFMRDPELANCYRKVFGESPLGNGERTVVNVGKALAAFQETLITGRTPFDDFRDALVRHDPAGIARYPASAQRGLRLFIGSGNCIACHSGANFSDDRFHRVLSAPKEKPPHSQEADTGRFEGVRLLRSSHLNLLSRYNDAPSGGASSKTWRTTVNDELIGQFRTPGLRNVAHTAPFFHDGRADTLQLALQHGSPLSSEQSLDLVAFLATLTDQYGERRPWITDDAAICR